MKVIFLDIDGPMIPSRAYFLKENRGKIGKRFDPVAACMLLDVLDVTRSKLVISATVGNFGYDHVAQLLEYNGIDRSYLHEDPITPRDIYRKREDQIDAWRDMHPEVDKYAVLDDENMFDAFGDHMVHVSFTDGMMFPHRDRLIQILGMHEDEEIKPL